MKKINWWSCLLGVFGGAPLWFVLALLYLLHELRQVEGALNLIELLRSFGVSA